MTVIGGDDRIDALTRKVSHGDKIKVGSLDIECLFTPCHTTGHICYFVKGDNPAVFTGDTLFLAGCGRFFEGTADQMKKNLVDTLGALPDECKVYCGHEYSVSNLKYAAHVEPENEDVKAKLKWCEEQRANSETTIPSTIAEEKKYNPFMRVQCEAVQRHTGKSEAVDVMAVIRKEKDNFKAKV